MVRAQPVDGFVPRNHHRPCKYAAARGIIRRRFFPHLDESFLQRVLRLFLVAKNLVNHGKQTRRKFSIKLRKGVFIASDDARNHLRIRHRNGAAAFIEI